MGRNFRHVLAASALLQPLGAEVITTSLRAEVTPVNVPTVSPVFSGGIYIPQGFTTLLTSIAHQEAIAPRMHLAFSGNLPEAIAQHDKITRTKRAPTDPVPVIPGPVGWEYLGCFIETGSIEDFINTGFYWQPANTGGWPAPQIMSADICTASCSTNERSAFAGLNGDTCYCFNEEPSPGSIQDICEKPCYNNEGETCGGDQADNVKLTVYRRTPEYNIVPGPADPPPNGWQYSGCFPPLDYSGIPIINGFSTADPTDGNYETSVEQCTTICNDNGCFPYAGTLPETGRLDGGPNSEDSDVSYHHPCPVYPNDDCGGPADDNVPKVMFRRNSLKNARTENEVEVRLRLSFVCSNAERVGNALE